MASERGRRVVQLLGIAILVITAILAQRLVPVSESSLWKMVLRIVIGLLPLGFVPLLASRLAPKSESKPIRIGRWLLVLGLVFLGQLASAFLPILFPSGGHVSNASFAIILLTVAIGVALILSWKTRNTMTVCRTEGLVGNGRNSPE